MECPKYARTCFICEPAEDLWRTVLRIAERAVLQAGSVAGEEFSAAAVAAGLGSEVWAIEGQCEAMAQRGQLLQRRGEQTWPDGTVATCYSFRPVWYRQVMYQEVTAAHRRRLHQRIGARLEVGYGVQAHEIAAELAMHFSQGGDPRRAVDYRAQAAQNALRQHASREGIAHLTRGLELLQRLPESPERSQRELALYIMLGAPLLAMKGSSAPEVERVYARARELCSQVGETGQLFTALRGLWDFHLLKADFQTARELGEQILSLGQRWQDAALLVEAQRALGTTLYWLGEMAPACAHLQQSIALYDAQQHYPQAFLYGQDSALACLAYLAWALWHCGYPDQALQRSHESLALARKLSHPFSLAYALTFAARLHQFRGEPQAVQELVAELMQLVTAPGFPHWSAHADSLQGWILTRQGQVKAGIVQLHQAMAAYQATGGELARSYLLPQLAEAYGKAGQHSKGLRLLAEVLRIVHNNGGHCLEAELYRLKGELLLQKRTARPAVEECLQQALPIARRQQLKSLELRAAVSLSRLWQRQGQGNEARRLLVEIYSWFSEGFDTTDLREAMALLGGCGGLE